MEEIKQNMTQIVDSAREEGYNALSEIAAPSHDYERHIFEEIPREDPTYQRLDARLITRFYLPEGIKVMRYFSITGSTALMPCCNAVDRLVAMETLSVFENGDPVFKQARDWACSVQAMPRLHKDVRWVLVVIFMLASQMLGLHVSEETIWAQRPWLMYWYEFADRLFAAYDVDVTSPEADYFVSHRRAGRLASFPEVEECERRVLDSSSETVVRRPYVARV